jgi:cell wall-associated NlpC family hydrolase
MTAQQQHPDLIDGLDDLRPGDIMLGPIGGLVPGLFPVGAGQLMLGEIFRAGGLSVRHAGIVVEASRKLPPGTVRHRGTGRYYGPESAQAAWSLRARSSYDVYETGVITAPRLVEAMPSGARERRLTADDWTRRHAYVRLPEDFPGQAADAAAIARAMVGTPYSFASYGALAAWRFGIRPRRLEKWIDRRTDPVYIPGPEFAGEHREPRLPREAICSVLVDQAWTLAGKQVMPHGTRPQVVTPGALAGRLLRLPDTRWGFSE